GLDALQSRLISRGEAREQADRRVDIQRPLFATRASAAASAKNALGLGGQGHRGDGIKQGLGHGGNQKGPKPLCQPLNRKFSTSPSLTTYSLPSARILPASLAPASPLNWMKSS